MLVKLNMNQCNVGLLDLPNEMLFNILKKLENVDVLYSFFGINNERLEKIIEDEFFSNSLNIASITENSTIIDSILDRFCDYILPRIYFNVKCFIVEPEFMKRILLATPYPNLTELKTVAAVGIVGMTDSGNDREPCDGQRKRHLF